MTAGGLSVAGGLALGWGAVDPAVVRVLPTEGLVLIVAMVALPVLLLATAGAVRLASAGATEIEAEIDTPHDAAHHVVRHESHGGDRHERPHAPRPHTHRPRTTQRAET